MTSLAATYFGRGLLAGPHEIARRTFQVTTWDHQFNAAEAVTQIHAKADALAGLLSLGVGFCLQWGGYVALIGGAKVETSLLRAGVSIVLALVAAGAAFLAFRRVRWHLVKRFTVQVARANPMTGQMDNLPDSRTLIELGQALGLGVVEVTPEGVVVVSEWAKETFGVEGVSNRLPFALPTVPRRAL